MKEKNESRRNFIKSSVQLGLGMPFILKSWDKNMGKVVDERLRYLKGMEENDIDLSTSRVFLLDAYQPPLVPNLQYNAKKWVDTMSEMGVNILRFGTMGKYSTITGTDFPNIPGQNDRDLLQETIYHCKKRGIKVFAYISTGHKLAWSIVTESYPSYGQKKEPMGTPWRDHMYVGEDMGTVCWQTPYREAWFKYLIHVVRDYEIDGVYFDAFFPFYFWRGKKVCYCDWCRENFLRVSGDEIPFNKSGYYNEEEEKIIDKYHEWYKMEFVEKVVKRVRPLVKSIKDIPLMSNINNPREIAEIDPNIISAMDAFLYERGDSLLERAEGIGAAKSLGLEIWPYIGTYHNWPRVAFQGVNYQQEIFTNLMFGAGSIVAQPTGYIEYDDNRNFISYPFNIIKENESLLKGLNNYPFVATLYSYKSPKDYERKSWQKGVMNARTDSLGAFGVFIYNHIQASSISEFVLDDINLLEKYSVLYLPNVPYINRKRQENIKLFVKNGGGLIVTGNTTLYNESGLKMPRFSLEELMKVKPIIPEGELKKDVEDYSAMIGGPNDLYLYSDRENDQEINRFFRRRLIPVWYYQPIEKIDNKAICLMDIVKGSNRESILPGIILNHYGKGKVLYCSSNLEGFYYYNKPKIIGDLVKNFVEIVSPSSIPYKLDGPEGLITNLTIKDNWFVLQMTNWTGNKFEKNLMNEYYTPQINNVEVSIQVPNELSIKRVFSLLGNHIKQDKISKGMLRIKVESIGAYDALCIQFDD